MNDESKDKSTSKKIKARPKETRLMFTMSRTINRSNRFMKLYLLNLKITGSETRKDNKKKIKTKEKNPTKHL